MEWGTKIKTINLYPKDDSKTKFSHALWSLEHDRVMSLSHWTNEGFWFVARTFWENIFAYNYQYSHNILSYIKIYIIKLYVVNKAISPTLSKYNEHMTRIWLDFCALSYMQLPTFLQVFVIWPGPNWPKVFKMSINPWSFRFAYCR